MKNNNNGLFNFALGLMFGAFVGYITGLLNAEKTGSELKRDLEQGILTKCEFCLNIWDGYAQCDCDERFECMNMQENKNYNSYINYLPNFSKFINFELYPKDTIIDVKSDKCASEMV